MNTGEINEKLDDAESRSGSDDASPAWEMIEAGRYRPRRIRGSCRGRELG
jgi:hypothetical protein